MDKDYEVISDGLIDQLVLEARATQRRRKNYNMHELTDTVQKFLNAIEPDSYVRPHRHIDPPKSETFFLLRGKLVVLLFSEDGKITDRIWLDPVHNPGINIKERIWHTIIALEPGTVCFEVKPGPYDPNRDKNFAPWAPPEGDSAVNNYMKLLISSR